MAKYNSRSSNKRQRCDKCKTLVNMTVDRIIKGKRVVLCMACFNKEPKESEQQKLFEDPK